MTNKTENNGRAKRGLFVQDDLRVIPRRQLVLTTRLVCFLFFVQELHELVRLHHEVQLLSLQLHVKQLGGEKLLPLLEKLDPLDRSD